MSNNTVLLAAHLTHPEPCCVCDQHCKSPANWIEVKEPKSSCFACGLKACINCSLVVKYQKYGRKRLCHNCLIQIDREDLVIAHIYRLAGYKKEGAAWIKI